jgi:quinol monooxygenase YgiN
MHWAEPAAVVEPSPDEGPVLVRAEYLIDPARADDFQHAMAALGRVRRRDGAMQWRVFRDPAAPGRYVEEFMSRSWVDHLREHERVTVEDRTVEDAARAFHMGDGPPRVEHLVAVRTAHGRR